ncbi:MAG TPA: hypothetical protein VEU08_16070 [Vicinamibacterales bacterium]|nr:hypothetical protein [Vicinamibacterales bacterium]
MVALLAPGARADEWNKRTFLTFSGPVQVPGATLPAGTYLFQLADPDNARHIVMVRDKDEKKIYSMFMTIPNDRLDTPSDNIVMFRESPAGVPRAVKAWWYPGQRIGEEFVYPKSQATQIARATHEGVLASDTSASTTGSDTDRAAMKNAKVARVNENGEVSGANTTQTAKPATTTAPRLTTTEPSPAPANTATGRNVSPQTTTATGTSGQSKRHLPRTAGELPLFQLLAGLCLGGGLSLRALRK